MQGEICSCFPVSVCSTRPFSFEEEDWSSQSQNASCCERFDPVIVHAQSQIIRVSFGGGATKNKKTGRL